MLSLMCVSSSSCCWASNISAQQHELLLTHINDKYIWGYRGGSPTAVQA